MFRIFCGLALIGLTGGCSLVSYIFPARQCSAPETLAAVRAAAAGPKSAFEIEGVRSFVSEFFGDERFFDVVATKVDAATGRIECEASLPTMLKPEALMLLGLPEGAKIKSDDRGVFLRISYVIEKTADGNSLVTIGQPDIVSEVVSKVWILTKHNPFARDADASGDQESIPPDATPTPPALASENNVSETDNAASNSAQMNGM